MSISKQGMHLSSTRRRQRRQQLTSAALVLVVGIGGLVRVTDAATAARRHEVEVNAELLAKYVGVYEFEPTFHINISLKDGGLRSQATNQDMNPIFAESDTEFFFKVVDAQITFVRDGSGKTEKLILHQNGRDLSAPRLEGQEATRAIESVVSKKVRPEMRLNSPKGWGGETIILPPPFAPDMNFRGIEELRFAPGWGKATSDEFLTYLFVFVLDGKQDLSQKVVGREVLTYFRGVANSTLGHRGLKKVDAEKFTLKLRKIESSGSKESPPEGVTSYAGKLDWIEPWVSVKSHTLFMEIQTWQSAAESKARYVFCSVSPKQRSVTQIWKQMRAASEEFRKTVQ